MQKKRDYDAGVEVMMIDDFRLAGRTLGTSAGLTAGARPDARRQHRRHHREVVSAVPLRPLPYAQPERLVIVREHIQRLGREPRPSAT